MAKSISTFKAHEIACAMAHVSDTPEKTPDAFKDAADAIRTEIQGVVDISALTGEDLDRAVLDAIRSKIADDVYEEVKETLGL